VGQEGSREDAVFGKDRHTALTKWLEEKNAQLADRTPRLHPQGLSRRVVVVVVQIGIRVNEFQIVWRRSDARWQPAGAVAPAGSISRKLALRLGDLFEVAALNEPPFIALMNSQKRFMATPRSRLRSANGVNENERREESETLVIASQRR
jgi:hypothetical protein